MVLQPAGDKHIAFTKGGVSLNVATTKVWLVFHTRNNRVVSEIPVPYYLFSKDNEKECLSMVRTAWNNAASMADEKVFSHPDEENLVLIVAATKELLRLK